MNPHLKETINLYVESCERLFRQLSSDLRITLPIRAEEWAGLGIEQSGVTSSGVKYRKHGFGVVMRQGDLVVDFDLGKAGELNGVDPWKLFYFAEKNNIFLPYASTKDIQEDFKSLEQTGQLKYSGYMLYYLAEGT